MLDERCIFWGKLALNPLLSQSLKPTLESCKYAQNYINAINESTLNQLTSSDHATRISGFKTTESLFSTHRNAVDNAVLAAQNLDKQANIDAQNSQHNHKLSLILGSVLLSLSAVAGAFIILRRIQYTLGTSMEKATDIAEAISLHQFDHPLLAEFDNYPPNSLAKTLVSASREVAKLQHLVQQACDQAALSAEDIIEKSRVATEGSGSLEIQISQAENCMGEVQRVMVEVLHVAAQSKESTSEAIKDVRTSLGKVQTIIDAIENISNAVDQSGHHIASLAEKAKEVTSATSQIKNIAAQTNLLALNAAIEAARAGEAGRGFAVVADEVRKLSENAATASVGIDATITGLVLSLQEATKIMEATRDMGNSEMSKASEAMASIEKLGRAVNHAKMAVTSIDQALEEQCTSMQTAKNAVEEISKAHKNATFLTASLPNALLSLDKIIQLNKV